MRARPKMHSQKLRSSSRFKKDGGSGTLIMYSEARR